MFLKISQNSQENTCARVSCLIKLQASGLRPAILLKKRLWLRCFSVNFVKFLRTSFLIENLWWLFLFGKIPIFWSLEGNSFSVITLRLDRNVILSQTVIVVSFHNNFIHKRWESSFKNWYVSVARALIFLWCIVRELMFSSNFKKMMTCHYMQFSMLFRAFDLFYYKGFDKGTFKLMGSIQITIL